LPGQCPAAVWIKDQSQRSWLKNRFSLLTFYVLYRFLQGVCLLLWQCCVSHRIYVNKLKYNIYRCKGCKENWNLLVSKGQFIFKAFCRLLTAAINKINPTNKHG